MSIHYFLESLEPTQLYNVDLSKRLLYLNLLNLEIYIRQIGLLRELKERNDALVKLKVSPFCFLYMSADLIQCDSNVSLSASSKTNRAKSSDDLCIVVT